MGIFSRNKKNEATQSIQILSPEKAAVEDEDREEDDEEEDDEEEDDEEEDDEEELDSPTSFETKKERSNKSDEAINLILKRMERLEQLVKEKQTPVVVEAKPEVKKEIREAVITSGVLLENGLIRYEVLSNFPLGEIGSKLDYKD